MRGAAPSHQHHALFRQLAEGAIHQVTAKPRFEAAWRRAQSLLPEPPPGRPLPPPELPHHWGGDGAILGGLAEELALLIETDPELQAGLLLRANDPDRYQKALGVVRLLAWRVYSARLHRELTRSNPDASQELHVLCWEGVLRDRRYPQLVRRAQAANDDPYDAAADLALKGLEHFQSDVREGKVQDSGSLTAQIRQWVAWRTADMVDDRLPKRRHLDLPPDDPAHTPTSGHPAPRLPRRPAPPTDAVAIAHCVEDELWARLARLAADGVLSRRDVVMLLFDMWPPPEAPSRSGRVSRYRNVAVILERWGSASDLPAALAADLDDLTPEDARELADWFSEPLAAMARDGITPEGAGQWTFQAERKAKGDQSFVAWLKTLVRGIDFEQPPEEWRAPDA